MDNSIPKEFNCIFTFVAASLSDQILALFLFKVVHRNDSACRKSISSARMIVQSARYLSDECKIVAQQSECVT